MTTPAGRALTTTGIVLVLAAGCARPPAAAPPGIDSFRSRPTVGRHYRLGFVTRFHDTLTRDETVDVEVVGVEEWGEGKYSVRTRMLWPGDGHARPEVISLSIVDHRWRWDKALENESATGLQLPMHDIVEALRAWLHLLGQGLPPTGETWSSCARPDRCLHWRAVALGGRRWQVEATNLVGPGARAAADITIDARMTLREGDVLPCNARLDHVWMWRGRPVTSKTIRLECVDQPPDRSSAGVGALPAPASN